MGLLFDESEEVRFKFGYVVLSFNLEKLHKGIACFKLLFWHGVAIDLKMHLYTKC